GFHVDADVRGEVPAGTDGCGQITLLDVYDRAMIDVLPVRRRARKFLPVEPGIQPCDDRPRISVSGPFACEVSGVEFLKGGVEVVEVERDVRDDLLVGVYLADGEQFSA